MEVKAGYKQTKAGTIPEDWDVVLLDSVARRGSGHTPDKAHPEYWGGTIKWISLQDSDRLDRLYIWDTAAMITQAGIANSSAKMHPKGTVVVSRDAGVGKSAIMQDDMAVSQHFIAWRCGPSLDNHFLYYWLQSNKLEFERIAMGNTIKTIGLPYFRQLAVPLPTKAEQEAIAEALSDADALIESLEQLLAKKRQLKQGIMQELLTGKKRLPGFSREWEMHSLGSIADPNQRWSFTGGPFGSNLKSSDYTDVGVRIIQLQNIGDGMFKDDYEIYTSRQKADELLSCNIYPGELILSKMGDPVARACIILPFQVRYVMCSDGIRLAVDKKRFNPYFVYTQINAPAFRGKAANAGTGSTRKRIGLTELKSLELCCPSFPEQTAIAAILSDMDAEIAALEAKLAKAHQLKQGMMQKLLMGRIRLV